MALQLHFDEVIGQRKLLVIKHAVLVDVCQLPDLPQHRVGQFGLHHLFLGVGAGHLAVDGRQRVEDLVVGGFVTGHHPLGLVDALAGTLAVAVAEGPVKGAVEGAALHHGVGTLGLLLADKDHQAGDVVGQHVVHGLQEFGLQRLEFVEVLSLKLVLIEEGEEE